jgi:hypothetical protein
MTGDADYQLRNRLTQVLLALQMLARRPRPWSRQQRIAAIGLRSARDLVDIVLNGNGATGSSSTQKGATR